MKWPTTVFVAIAFFCSDADAVVSLAGTRLVFDGRFHETTIDVSNPGNSHVLIQAWLADPRTGTAAVPNLPFALTPHLVRLRAHDRQTLRLLYQGVGMPADRESLLHLYVLEVPRRSEASQQLSIAVRQRINVFYRPAGLPGDPPDAAQKLSWRWDEAARATLTVHNPTPFHVSLHRLAFNEVGIAEDLMLEPFSTHSLPLPKALEGHAGEGALYFKALTDYGGLRDFCAQSRGSSSFNAWLRPPAVQSSIGTCQP
ncbi:molecular chaperone [Pseudomonas sp. LP_7_YM]|uniref:fimbrial biogenesis chaperone n=1 Tax=Pseudomonas sp. LP_7_YM TaxID=2485137 RepID=UPI00105F3F47|nr:molecular chaperone [Pseudomonas sp. LP_7_YM]TDV60796.1 P pilus assembly chaperone PapD [Pseudomonas sp. LP_7_YM]